MAIVLVFMCVVALSAGCSAWKNNLQGRQGIDGSGPAGSDLLPGVGPDAIADVVSRSSPAVVQISTSVSPGNSSAPQLSDPLFRQFFGLPSVPKQEVGIGSGFIISVDGYILTNEHVIDGANEIYVMVFGFDQEIKATVIGADYDLDLALLKIDAGKDLPYLPLGSSDQIRVGNWVIAIGNPYGLDHTVTTGVISAKGRPISVQDRQYENLLQTDASINPGNSGGPLLNLMGEVVGINTAINAQAQGIGFAIPTSTVQQVMEDLKSSTSSIRPWIGVHVRSMDGELTRYLGLDKSEGALVAGVAAGSPAERAGFREWDVIVEFNGKKVGDADELVSLIRDSRIGENAKIVVIRQRQLNTITVTIAEKPKNIR